MSAYLASQLAQTTAPQAQMARTKSVSHEQQPGPERRQQPKSSGCPVLLK
jgi:hypothetical protein